MFKCRIIDIVLTSAVLFVSAPPEDSRCRLCPEGWLWWRWHCYFFSVGLQEDRRWNESAEFCQEHNSSLVVIKDDAEMVTDRRETKTKMAAFTLQSEVTRFRCFVKSDFFFCFFMPRSTAILTKFAFILDDGEKQKRSYLLRCRSSSRLKTDMRTRYYKLLTN
uniref:C-type lectin domain-containing protein n=1 Tax=Xiphophorus maculatus TaxID=8083 RepID=A0A3B5PY43_XIPMA